MVNFFFDKKKSKKNKTRPITFQEIQQHFDLPIKDASEKIGISLTQLKRVCREQDIPRWPYRKLQSIQKNILELESQLQTEQDEIIKSRINEKIINLKKDIDFIKRFPKSIVNQNSSCKAVNDRNSPSSTAGSSGKRNSIGKNKRWSLPSNFENTLENMAQNNKRLSSSSYTDALNNIQSHIGISDQSKSPEYGYLQRTSSSDQNKIPHYPYENYGTQSYMQQQPQYNPQLYAPQYQHPQQPQQHLQHHHPYNQPHYIPQQNQYQPQQEHSFSPGNDAILNQQYPMALQNQHISNSIYNNIPQYRDPNMNIEANVSGKKRRPSANGLSDTSLDSMDYVSEESTAHSNRSSLNLPISPMNDMNLTNKQQDGLKLSISPPGHRNSTSFESEQSAGIDLDRRPSDGSTGGMSFGGERGNRDSISSVENYSSAINPELLNQLLHKPSSTLVSKESKRLSLSPYVLKKMDNQNLKHGNVYGSHYFASPRGFSSSVKTAQPNTIGSNEKSPPKRTLSDLEYFKNKRKTIDLRNVMVLNGEYQNPNTSSTFDLRTNSMNNLRNNFVAGESIPALGTSSSFSGKKNIEYQLSGINTDRRERVNSSSEQLPSINTLLFGLEGKNNESRNNNSIDAQAQNTITREQHPPHERGYQRHSMGGYPNYSQVQQQVEEIENERGTAKKKSIMDRIFSGSLPFLKKKKRRK